MKYNMLSSFIPPTVINITFHTPEHLRNIIKKSTNILPRYQMNDCSDNEPKIGMEISEQNKNTPKYCQTFNYFLSNFLSSNQVQKTERKNLEK